MTFTRIVLPLGLGIPLALASLGIAADVTGWRTDGTGHYPEAKPPTSWGKDEGVVWKAKLPGKSHSAPIVVGDQVFVTADPAHLLCFDAASGDEKWSRSVGYADLYGPEKLAEVERVQARAKAIEQEAKELRKALRDRQRANEITKEEEQREKKRIDALEENAKAIRAEFPAEKRGGSGNAAGTPVSDGECVYCLFATGLVTAHTLAGERQWFEFVEPAVDGFGHSASPMLVDGKLIVHTGSLTALDPKTGRELWKADLPKRWGTPVATRIGSDWVVITPSGALVRASDGVVLAQKLFDVPHASPIVEDGVVYAISKKNVAVRLPGRLGDAETVEATTLWEEEGPRTRTFSSALLHDGLIYNVDERGILEVYDVGDGSRVYQERLPFQGGRAYSSVTRAGDLLFAGNDRGEMVVFRPGRSFEQVAHNELEGFSGAPVFVGTRMYLRGYEHLYCIGK